jgi:hypothetical protein
MTSIEREIAIKEQGRLMLLASEQSRPEVARTHLSEMMLLISSRDQKVCETIDLIRLGGIN